MVADTGGLLRGLASTRDGKPSFPEYEAILTSASLVIVPGLVLAEVDYFLWENRVAMRKLVDLGLFHGDPVELIGGQLVVSEPQGGVDKFQALSLALDFIRKFLKGFVGQGGRVLHPEDGSAIDLDDPSFCPHLDIRHLRQREKTRGRRG